MKLFTVVSGRDCDGQYARPRFYEFETEVECLEFCDNCNEGSDGIFYFPVNERGLDEYCVENEIERED